MARVHSIHPHLVLSSGNSRLGIPLAGGLNRALWPSGELPAGPGPERRPISGQLLPPAGPSVPADLCYAPLPAQAPRAPARSFLVFSRCAPTERFRLFRKAARSFFVRFAMVVRARPKCAQSSETDCFSSLASCCNPVIILPRILRIALISPHRRVISSVSMLSAPFISFRYSWIPPAGETPEGGLRPAMGTLPLACSKRAPRRWQSDRWRSEERRVGKECRSPRGLPPKAVQYRPTKL